MQATALPTPRFRRKTTLAENEYRKNFRQIDNDVIEVITSPEADAVTPLMSKIYLKLTNAPIQYVESAGALRFTDEVRDGKRRTAWQVLCELLNVSSSTANKALKWMSGVGLIGYWAGKNGAGVRIFLNRANASIGIKLQSPLKKILPFPPAPSDAPRASFDEAGFSGSHAEENLDLNNNSRPPDGGADHEHPANEPSGPRQLARHGTDHPPTARRATAEQPAISQAELIHNILSLLKPQLDATIQSAAKHAAAREQDKTREWLEKFGLPKVARVAQRESYNVLRQQGYALDLAGRARLQLQVGASPRTWRGPTRLSAAEIADTAEFCVFRLQTDGQSIDVTLAEISAESGGYLLAEDAPMVREMADELARLHEAKECP